MTENPFGTPSVDQLAALQEQRTLLRMLQDDVRAAWRQLDLSDLDASWRSEAQRAYSERVEYLRGELRGTLRDLDDAQAAVNGSIGRVQAGA